MKFVHLAPQPAISRIRKNGIRTGDGLRGRGVYAVPLAMLESACCASDERVFSAGRRSSLILWKWLSRLPSRHQHLSAIIFETSQEHWPADLHIEIAARSGINWIKQVALENVEITAEELRKVQIHIESGLLADLHAVVHGPVALGQALHSAQKAGFHVWSSYCESLEIVFPAAVKSSLIHRIVPLYRTNRQFKANQRKECTMRVDSD